MADLSQLEAALVKADAAGNAEDARALAGEIRRLRSFSAIKSEGQVEKPPTPYHPSGETALTPQEEVFGNPMVRGVIGAVKPFVGAGQLAANAVGLGKPVNEAIAETERNINRGRNYIGSTGFDAFQAGGQLASPLFLGAAGAMPATATAGGRIAQGAGMGALAGATEPVNTPDYWGTKAAQVGGGAVLGAAVPAAWELAKLGGRGVRNIVQPYMGQAGADKAAGRLLNEVAGQKAPQVIQNLENPQTIVPGASPTAGQAAVPAGSAEFSALQNIAAQKDPSKYGVAGIEGAQQNARLAAVRSVGQTPEDLKAAELVRQLSAKQNYGKAFEQGIKADPELAQLAKNPFFKAAMPDAMRLAEAEGISPKTDLTQFLHYVKVSLDKQLTKTGDTALANTEKRAVENVKSDLVDWMARKNPAYENARQVFANQSKPINQMEVGQYLEGKLTNPLETGERAGVYAQALRDAAGTLKRSTGQPRYSELGQVLEPSQVQSVNAVGEDLKRNALLKALSSEGMTAAKEKIGQAIPEAPPSGMFSPIISVTRGLYNRATGKATEKLLSDLAANMDNPQKIAQMMKEAKPFERQALVDALMKYQAVLPAAASQEIQ